MTEPYNFETATERERAAYDQGIADAFDPLKMDEEDLVLVLAVCTDAAGRLLRKHRKQQS